MGGGVCPAVGLYKLHIMDIYTYIHILHIMDVYMLKMMITK